jgi:integrase
LRASEIGMLQRTDVDLKSGRLTIQRTKGSLSGVYAMQPDEIKTLRAYVATRADSSPLPLHFQPHPSYLPLYPLEAHADLRPGRRGPEGEAEIPRPQALDRYSPPGQDPVLSVIRAVTRGRAVTRREEPGPRGALTENGFYVIYAPVSDRFC